MEAEVAAPWGAEPEWRYREPCARAQVSLWAGGGRDEACGGSGPTWGKLPASSRKWIGLATGALPSLLAKPPHRPPPAWSSPVPWLESARPLLWQGCVTGSRRARVVPFPCCSTTTLTQVFLEALFPCPRQGSLTAPSGHRRFSLDSVLHFPLAGGRGWLPQLLWPETPQRVRSGSE